MITNIYPGESSSIDYVVLELNQAQNLKYHQSRSLDLKATGLLFISEYNCVVSDCWLNSKRLISATPRLQAVRWARSLEQWLPLWGGGPARHSSPLRIAAPWLPVPIPCLPTYRYPLSHLFFFKSLWKTQEFCVWEEVGGATILQPFCTHGKGTSFIRIPLGIIMVGHHSAAELIYS